MKKQKIVLIGGPTAVGKTGLGIALANLFNGEIVNADSIQIYKELNIGSAKPTSEELALAKHHLINIVKPGQEYSAAEYKKDAENVIEKLKQEKKLPIIVGGTGFYMKSLLFPLEFGRSFKDQSIRDKYNQLAKEKGNQFVYDTLQQIDPEAAKTIHANDIKRVIRALEIFELSGQKKSDMKLDLDSKYDYFLIFLNDDRNALYNRIDTRVEQMFSLGLEQEVKGLISAYKLTPASQSMQAIGYKEFFDYFDGKLTLEQVKEQIKLNSHHYAKRQITWFKAMPNVHEFVRTDTQKIILAVTEFLSQSK